MSPNLVLHHYTSGAGLIGILDTCSIWASNIHQLNDAMEFKYALSLAKQEIARLAMESNDDRAKLLSDRLSNLIERCADFSVYVSCFSEVRDSLSQWRGYCPPGFGYSIGFDEQHLRTVAAEQGFVLSRCIYDETKQREAIGAWAQKTFMHLLQYFDVASSIDITDKAAWPKMMSLLVQAPFLKHSSFREESEWRMVKVVSRNDQNLKLRPSEHMLISYLPVMLPLSTDSDLIWDLCVGPTPHPKLAMNAITHYFHKIKIRNGIGSSQSPYRSW